MESPVAQWLKHPTRSRRVVGSNPIWNSDFFSEFPFDVKTLSCCYFFKTRLDGWMVASLICLNVTARCSYESYVPYWFDYVTA